MTRSSDRGIDPEERERILQRIEKAGLPLKVRNLTQKDFGGKGRELFDYLRSNAYASDLSQGIGVCLSGDPTIRSDLLAMMAKPAVFEGRAVRLLSLHYLVALLDSNSEDLGPISRVEFLYVDWFERDFGSAAQCPYSHFQLCNVEDFLSKRMHAGKVTNFSACRVWNNLTWWSRDFLGLMAPKVQNIVL